jgi:histidinol-phosphate aminotransferase
MAATTDKPAHLAVAAVRNLAPYVTGKPISELGRELGITDIIKLASNENPLGPSPLVLRAMQAALNEVRLYPDGNGHDLKVALAARHRVSLSQVTLGNGSNDLLNLLAEAFLISTTRAVYSQYAFAIYELVVAATGAMATVVPARAENSAAPFGHDLEAMLAAVTPDTRLVFIANPNNPTGSWNDAAAVRRFLERVPATCIVVLDEAYFEYARTHDCPDGVELTREFSNLVVLRTFSKAHALAGVRLGYAISHPDVADVLNRVRQPFNVNLIALVAAKAALADTGQVDRAVALVAAGVPQVTRGLQALGVKVYPTAGNFVLADVGASGQVVYEKLLHKGVIVRPVGSYGLTRCVRITIGTEQQNERLLQAMSECI